MRVAQTIRLAILGCACAALQAACALAQQPEPSRVLLDRVVAVVNNNAILASDLDREQRLSVLEADSSNQATDSKSALERIISRTLIQQQIRREAELAVSSHGDDVQTRLTELRKELPACAQLNCATEEGWTRFLLAHALTQSEVDNYLRLRAEMLAFIENRFQQGIRIAPEEIEDYYNKTLVPEYPKGQHPPALNAVSHRIEEILLQQRVNNMFGTWLDNLRKQGDVQILDPTLESAGESATREGNAQ